LDSPAAYVVRGAAIAGTNYVLKYRIRAAQASNQHQARKAAKLLKLHSLQQGGALMNPEDEVIKLLREHDAVLSRRGKHNVWALPNGKTFTTARSPSDWRAGVNSLHDLRILLGIQDENRGRPGERRQRKIPPPDQPAAVPKRDPQRENRMKLAGIVKAPLSHRVSALLEEMRLMRR
jgi:hypothetical protein